MIKTENILSSLKVEIPVLEENAEGQLKGGFGTFGGSDTDTYGYNDNCNCNCGDCDINGNCNCNCGSCVTNKSMCTTTKTARGVTSVFNTSGSMLF